MRILAANLRLLYQRRLVWLFCVPVFLLFWAVAEGTTEEGGPVVSLLAAAICGCALGTHQRETLSRPFAFLLPRHGWLVPRQSLVQSALCGVLVAWCWAGGAETSFPQQLGVLAATWLLGTASCMAGTALGFALPSLICVPLFMSMVALRPSLDGSPPMAALVFSLVVRSRPAAVAAGAVALIAWSWRRLGRRDLARSWCGVPSPFHKRKMAQYQRWHRKAKVEDEPELGSHGLACRCLAGMRRNRPDSVWRYCHAVSYEWFGNLTPRLVLRGLGFAMVLVLWFAYSRGGVIFAFLPAIAALSLRQAHANTFVSLSRRQRSVLAMTGMLVLTALATGFVMLLVIATQVAAPLMPTWTLGRATMSFHPLALRCALIPAASIPLAMATMAWLGKRRSLVKVALVVPALLFFPGLMLFLAEDSVGTLVLWLALILVAMLVSVRFLRHHCLCRDLA